ncbi:MAG: hypothetical protein J6I73_04350 [Treponema sp.]|nr:hypothetical protein [Treponema sp.]
MNLLSHERRIKRKLNKNATPAVIPILLDSIDEMSYKHDPRSREEMQLNSVIEEYLLDEVRRVPIYSPIVIAFHFVHAQRGDEETAMKIIHNNFTRLLQDKLLSKKRERRRWRINLVIGGAFLAVCLTMSHVLGMKGTTPLIDFLRESFGIIGWVALWEPVSYFLYGWRDGADVIAAAVKLQLCTVQQNSVLFE